MQAVRRAPRYGSRILRLRSMAPETEVTPMSFKVCSWRAAIQITMAALAFCVAWTAASGDNPVRHDLEVGAAGHAFDHLGNLGFQAPAAIESGATILYC